MRVSIIAAVARNGTIGLDNRLPWRLSADLRHFKATTMGHHLIMGRKTFQSTGSLPGRVTIVLSRRGLEAPPDGVRVVTTLDDALELARVAGEEEAFVAGGAEIYREALGRVDRLYLTRVDAEVAGDTSFPEIDPEAWREVESRSFPADEKNQHPYTFVVLERRAEAPRGAPRP